MADEWVLNDVPAQIMQANEYFRAIYDAARHFG